MNTLELMDASVSSFSKTDRQIYERIRKFPEEFATCSITEVSDNTRVTKPALTRFAKKLGFNGFAELQYQLAQDLKEMKENPVGDSNSEKYASLLIQTEKSVDKEAVRRLIRRMKSSRKELIRKESLSMIRQAIRCWKLISAGSSMPAFPHTRKIRQLCLTFQPGSCFLTAAY